MAKIIGGLHGRSSGNVGGIVYGAARTRTGKVVTARELVIPANPNTPEQQIRRLIFAQSLFSVRSLAPGVYNTYFNRSIGQLPGFHSMMSIIMNNTEDDYSLTVPVETPLGSLSHLEALDVQVAGSDPGNIEMSWDPDVGLNGTSADKVNIFTVSYAPVSVNRRQVIVLLNATTRITGGWAWDGYSEGSEHLVAVWVEGVGNAAGLISNCKWAKGVAGVT